MERLTLKNGECKMKNCFAEEWMAELFGHYSEKNICNSCPFINVIDELAKYEDEKEIKNGLLR